MARVLVVLTDGSPSVRTMTGWLAATGCALDVRRPFVEAAVPAVRAFHGLVVLGGDFGSGASDGGTPWTAMVRDRIREAARRGVPTLALGPGHLVAADALGGTVVPSPYGREAGLLDVGWGCEVLLDPLFDRVAGEDRAPPPSPRAVTALPPGGVVLARIGQGHIQVARLAATVWGVHYVPGADPDTDNDDIGRPLAVAFARMVRGRAGAHGELWE